MEIKGCVSASRPLIGPLEPQGKKNPKTYTDPELYSLFLEAKMTIAGAWKKDPRSQF